MGRLTNETRALVEIVGFKKFLELQSIEPAKKTLIYCLANRWWDITHTFQIAGREMTVTPCDIYRLIGLRVGRLTSTFNAFLVRLRVDQGYLSVSLGVTSTNLQNVLLTFYDLPQTTKEERIRMAMTFILYLIGMILVYNTSQTVPVRWLHFLVDF